jgi:hypothetical protein
MDAVLCGIDSLPGDRRYAVRFRRADGSEQAAVVRLIGDRVEVAPASLPSGWPPDSPALSAALQAFDAACRIGPPVPTLRDVNGGWDVSLGNVVLHEGRPRCTAHGDLDERDGAFVCETCGARAALG